MVRLFPELIVEIETNTDQIVFDSRGYVNPVSEEKDAGEFKFPC